MEKQGGSRYPKSPFQGFSTKRDKHQSCSPKGPGESQYFIYELLHYFPFLLEDPDCEELLVGTGKGATNNTAVAATTARR